VVDRDGDIDPAQVREQPLILGVASVVRSVETMISGEVSPHLTTMLSEIREVVEESSRKLYQMAIPPVKYWLLWDVMGKDFQDPLVQQARIECESYPPRVRLLDALREDGTWPLPKQKMAEEERGPGPPVGWTYITILRNLYSLGDWNVRYADGNVRAAFEKILSWQHEDGYIRGPISNAFPTTHYNGFALRNLIQFDMAGDSRTQRLIEWFLKTQRDDGGWNMPYIQDMRYRPEYAGMKMPKFIKAIESGELPPYDPKEYSDIPSCQWTTAMIIRAFCWDPPSVQRPGIRRAADFVLDRFFQRSLHPSYYQSADNWTKLKYPTYLGSGLSVLEVLTCMGYGPEDERMEKPIKWLLSQRSKDGLWHRADRPNPEKDQWISEIAINVLSKYADIY
jgi:hypothetical protein